MQQLLDFDGKLIELFCPSCLQEQHFKPSEQFDCHCCCECGFPVCVEFRDESNTYIDADGKYIIK